MDKKFTGKARPPMPDYEVEGISKEAIKLFDDYTKKFSKRKPKLVVVPVTFRERLELTFIAARYTGKENPLVFAPIIPAHVQAFISNGDGKWREVNYDPYADVEALYEKLKKMGKRI